MVAVTSPKWGLQGGIAPTVGDARHDSSTVMTSPIVSRLPTAYGNAACDIHTAELMGMIAGLRYRSPAIGTCMLVTEAPFSLFSAAFPMHTLRRVSSAQPTSR